jgi:hypothetical protein
VLQITNNNTRKRFKFNAVKNAGKSPTGNSNAELPGAAVATWEVEEEGEDPVSYFLGTRPPGPAEPFVQLIRGHWGGCEIRNHGTRDVQWEEDKTRSGNWALNVTLAIVRVALLSVKFRQGVTLS